MQRQGLSLSPLLKKLTTNKPYFCFFFSSPYSSSPHSPSSHHSKPFLKTPPLIDFDLPEIWTPNTPKKYPSWDNHEADNRKTATTIDGVSIAEEIRSGIADEVNRMKNATGKVPGLAVILVGNRKDSQAYVRNKIKACHEVGIMSLTAQFPDECGEDEVLRAVSSFNENPSVNGVLVQLPLPKVIT